MTNETLYYSLAYGWLALVCSIGALLLYVENIKKG